MITVNDQKIVQEISLVRFESNDYINNNTNQQLSQIIQETPHLPVNNQGQNMDNQLNIQPEERELDKLTNHDGGVTARDT